MIRQYTAGGSGVFHWRKKIKSDSLITMFFNRGNNFQKAVVTDTKNTHI